ncbi:MAG: ABC transporter substrate-binding protein [Pigeon pea little leaf phytoplasma]|uniref:ABC transporter substrate-binding protein n=1 Tax=Candidatus Phytoplasma fabacearum TaxID=2982628 RepID=UPI002712F680|nr:ABC transporter substrate-binding protein ['Bituminaria bituminosa' little leaf phytoplasma]MDV3148607.1 ABC transporter substrate-binding protein [Pigeon pea little leaf phytoplasma]MDO8023734.1 ABC transporter substrate-binding protein ['Bituminaria bituminosa' little leaf phytoplasma]MDO8030535.1 ABC transporter substrate-binding protein ['Bituminaria bituminosa' little leaf phytoplasma]MDV3158586.1 ABC transporter substrate-binding protein [Pigeon pea little leaf phytoplasma]MDV3188757.
MSKIFIYFSAIIIFIIISNSLRTSKNNEFFTKKYHDLGNLVSKKFHNHESQISYFKNLKKPVEIIFWHNLYPRELEIVKQSIKEFEQHNPNIKIKDVNKVNWEQICKSVANSLPVDKQPNIVFSYDDHIEFYSKSFKVVPLDIFIDYDEDFRNTPETKNKYSFFKGYAKKLQLPNVYDGKPHHYSLPFVKSTEVMFYDSDLFKQYRDELNKFFYEKHKIDFKDYCSEIIDYQGKFDFNTLKVNKDYFIWPYLETLSSKLVELKKDPTFIPIASESLANLIIISNEQKGISYPKDSNSIKSFLLDENVKNNMQYFKEHFYNKGLLTSSKLIGISNKEMFMKRKTGIFITSTRRSDLLHNQISDFNIEMTPFPCMSYTDEYKNIIQGPNVNLFYSEDNDKILASWLFLKHLLSRDVYIDMLLGKGGFIITREDVLNTLKNLKSPNEQNYVEEQIQKLTKSIFMKQNISDKQNSKIIQDKKTEIRELYKYKSVKFALEHTYDSNNKDTYFTTPIFSDVVFFRLILNDLFAEILAIDNQEINLKQKINCLFMEAYTRIAND